VNAGVVSQFSVAAFAVLLSDGDRPGNVTFDLASNFDIPSLLLPLLFSLSYPLQNGRRGSASLFQTWIDLISFVVRALLWPLRRVSDLLLPPGEFDGLSPAVTEKATQQFVNYLKALTTNPTQLVGIQVGFATTGFAALKQEATATNSILFVYLHSPLHRQADSVCRRLLLSPTMLEFLAQDNIRALGSSIHTSQGASLASQLSAASFPLVALLQPTGRAAGGNSTGASGNAATNNSNNDRPVKLIFKAEGPALTQMSSSQLLKLLVGTYQRHQVTIQEQEARRLEREQEAELRRQQDEEYQEGLRADQERERRRQEEQDEKDRAVREEEERERKKVQEEQNRLNRARAMIRAEPATGGTRIRFQLPTGQKLERRFENDETIGALKAYLIVHFADMNGDGANAKQPPAITNIGLSTNFPKRTHDDDDKTLQESDLCPQAVLMVQDLDA
jgi:hypothetical protein